MFPYFASAEVARKERKQYGPVPPHPLAAELDSWTPDLREMELLDHRIQALAWELRGQVGLELRAAWIIRGAKTSYDRALERLATIACGPHAAAELKPALQQALHPEQAAAGGTYDDLGHPERQPHLREGRRWEDAFGDNLLGEPLAAERCAVSPSGKDLVMDYKGLSGGVPYELLVTYVQSRNETRRQRLVAVGAGGTFEVHPAMLLPTRPRQYSFTLPAAIAPDGKLTLRFIPVDGRPHNAVASEVRLTPLATR